MAYEQSGKIEAVDVVNQLIGPVPTAQRLNTLWGYGFGNRGYGQSPLLPNVNVGDPVLASDWNGMKNLTNTIAQHQATLLSYSVPKDTFAPGINILYNQGLTKTYIDKIDTNRMSSAVQGNYSVYTVENAFSWTNKLTYTMTATFPTGDSARFFFNCGGQLAVRTWQPGYQSGVPTRLMISRLAQEAGTIYWSAMAGGSTKTKIAGVEFAATTKIGGSGTPGSISGSQDYFQPTTYTSTPVSIFKQTVSNGVPGYDASFIEVLVNTSGDKGSYGANGNVITLKLVVDVAPYSTSIAAGGIGYLYVIPPIVSSQSYLTQESWGIPSVVMSVTAQ
jgi:hypothetical protein